MILAEVSDRIRNWADSLPEPTQHLLAAIGSSAAAAVYFAAEMRRVRQPDESREPQSLATGLGFIAFGSLAISEFGAYRETKRSDLPAFEQ